LFSFYQNSNFVAINQLSDLGYGFGMLIPLYYFPKIIKLIINLIKKEKRVWPVGNGWWVLPILWFCFQIFSDWYFVNHTLPLLEQLSQ
jgi:hypothetical protein|tara:strand:- start:254 stop:517 length:264 start_codon:yes stop_codon:yes gene_type:complete